MGHKADTVSPKDTLLGMTVGSGWRVIEFLSKPDGATGGNFSTGYIVQKGETKAFLKAMDLTAALLAEEDKQLDALRFFVDVIQFEERLLDICKERRLSRIVHLLERDVVSFDTSGDPIRQAANKVYIFIFELGTQDIRRAFGVPNHADVAERFIVLRNVATAIKQLHTVGIAHQDVKPSNVLVFGEADHKLADLGSASFQGHKCPTDIFLLAGDPSYSPPELAYGYAPEDYAERRFGTDVYLLGSLCAFLFSMQSATTLMQQAIPCQFLPPRWMSDGSEPPWTGSFDDVLPHLIQAHSRVAEYLKQYLPEFCREELCKMFIELTHPDPHVRGHPKARLQSGRSHGVDRYISIFDRLSKAAVIERRKAEKA